MVINTSNFEYATSYGSEILRKKYKESPFEWHFETRNRLLCNYMADFIISGKRRFLFGEFKKATPEVSSRKYLSTYVSAASSIDQRLDRLEEQFNNLVKSTWNFVFSAEDRLEMRELSKGMLEDSKKMQELAEKLRKENG